MKAEQENLCPFVILAKRRYFYTITLLGLVGSLIDMIINLFQGNVSFRFWSRLAFSVGNISALLIFRAGRQSSARVVSCGLYYALTVALIVDQRTVLHSPVVLVCFFVMLRNHFLYDKHAWNLMLAGSVVAVMPLLILQSTFFISEKELLLTAAEVRYSLLANATAIVVCLISEVYFERVRQSVFEEVKNYSDRTERAAKEKEVFFAGMSHDIRNPLQSLLGTVELLQTSKDDKACQQDSHISVIKTACNVVVDIVSNFLDVSKLEASKMELVPVSSSLNESVNKIVRLFHARAKDKGLSIAYIENGAIPPCLLFDPHRLQQVILNIVSNSVKFTLKGRILIRTTWIPVGSSAQSETMMRTELGSSDWRSIIYDMEELEDEKQEWSKRQKLSQSDLFTPSFARSALKTNHDYNKQDEEVKLRSLMGHASKPQRVISWKNLSLGADSSVQDTGHWLHTCKDETSFDEFPFKKAKFREASDTPFVVPAKAGKGDNSHADTETPNTLVPRAGRGELTGHEDTRRQNMLLPSGFGKLDRSEIDSLAGSPVPKIEKSSDTLPANIPISHVPRKGLIKIEIMDTGPGISKSAIERLFKPYQQADATISHKYGGTGLGLWMSRSILQLMGGDIKMKSTVNFGTNIIIVIPSETCPETSSVEEEPGTILSPKITLRNKRCLILEDIAENTYVLQGLFLAQGMSVISRDNAKAALEILKSRSGVDLVVTDLRLPEMSGQQFIIEVRKFEQQNGLPRVPVIVLTGEVSPNEKVDCLGKYGADDYLLKPARLEVLLNSAERLLCRKITKPVKNVLIVDDDTMCRKLMIGLVKNAGENPRGCESIAEAKAEFEKNYDKYDLIFLDNELADGTGLDFMAHYEQVVRSKNSKRVPVISMSGNPVAVQAGFYKDFVMHAFIEKPIPKATLLDIIRSVY